VDQHVKDEERHQADHQERSSSVAGMFGEAEGLDDQEEVEPEDDDHADEPPLFSEDGEDEVGVAGGDEAELSLRAALEALAVDAAGADGNLGLRDLVTLSERIAVGIEKSKDALLLIRL